MDFSNAWTGAVLEQLIVPQYISIEIHGTNPMIRSTLLGAQQGILTLHLHHRELFPTLSISVIAES